jgi:hypothetical protein
MTQTYDPDKFHDLERIGTVCNATAESTGGEP